MPCDQIWVLLEGKGSRGDGEKAQCLGGQQRLGSHREQSARVWSYPQLMEREKQQGGKDIKQKDTRRFHSRLNPEIKLERDQKSLHQSGLGANLSIHFLMSGQRLTQKFISIKRRFYKKGMRQLFSERRVLYCSIREVGSSFITTVLFCLSWS